MSELKLKVFSLDETSIQNLKKASKKYHLSASAYLRLILNDLILQEES